MLLTDTHCHLDFRAFNNDRLEVISRAKSSGVTRLLVPGLDHRSGKTILDLAESEECIFAAVGFHPTSIDLFTEISFLDIQNQSKHTKVVAIGEIGLDYYWVKEIEKRKAQQDILKKQLAFAAHTNKPAIIHMREEDDRWHGQASDDLLGLITDWYQELVATSHPLSKRAGALHSYNGSLVLAQQAIDMGFYIGVTGPITYKNADRKRQIIKQLPLERLLIETDSPFLTPVPYRGKRNEPVFVHEIADKIAEVKSKDIDEIAFTTTMNAKHLFHW